MNNRIIYIVTVFLILFTSLQAQNNTNDKEALVNTPFVKGTLKTNGRWYGYLNQNNVKGKKVTKITTNILQAGVFKIGIGYLNPFINENEVQIIKEINFEDTGIKTIELNEVIPEDQYLFFAGYWGFGAGTDNPVGGGFIDFGNRYYNYDLGIGIEVESAGETSTPDPNILVNTPFVKGSLMADGRWYGYLNQDNVKGKKATKITTNILQAGVFKIGIGYLNPFINESEVQIIKEVRFYDTGVKTIILDEVIPEDQYLFFAGNWGFSSGANNPIGGGFISFNSRTYYYDLGIGIEVAPAEDTPPIPNPEEKEPVPYKKGKEGSVHIWISDIDRDWDGVGFQAYDFDKNQERSENTGFQGTYKTIGIGEYEYTKDNLKAKNRQRWGLNYTWYNWTPENINSISKSYNSEAPLNVDDFTKTYGTWFSLLPNLSAYANPEHVKFRDKENGNEIQGWGLPSIEDILQMIGQMPSTGDLNQDLLRFVGASSIDVPAGHTADWYNQCTNISGLTLTPLGSREPIEGDLTQYVYEHKKTSRIRLKSPLNEAIFSFSTNGSQFIPKLYHYTQIRYSRAKTDEELGYKMYIDNCNDAVVILPYDKFTKFTELPKGLERGIALRYMDPSDKKIYKKWSKICSEADRIRGNLIDVPARPELPISPCDDGNKDKPDPYEKGKEGSVHIWISEIGADWDGAGFQAYDFDKNQERSENTGFQGTYKTIGIGEYEYTKDNLKAKNRQRWGFDYTWYNWTVDNINSISKGYNSETPLSVDEFTKTYGTWFSLLPNLSAYANPEHVKFRDKENGNEIQGWGLPTIEDILQMIGQMPSTGDLNQDLLRFVGASSIDVPTGHSADWYNQCTNISGLTLTPLGSREPIEGDLTQYVYEHKKTSRIRLKSPLNEAIFSFSTNGSQFIPKLYHYTQIRYSRAKTNEELGYKIFVDLEKDSVIIAPLSQVCNRQLLELSHGLERGIVLRYSNFQLKKVFRSWSQIKDEAIKIKGTIQNIPDTDPLKACFGDIEVTAVSLNKAQLSLSVGDKYTLVATIMPENATDKSLLWSSSDQSVATVSSTGEVKAIKEGTTIITVITNNGAKTASCSIIVKKENGEPEDPIIPDLPVVPKLPEDPKYPEISDTDYTLSFKYNPVGDRTERNEIIFRRRISEDNTNDNIFTDKLLDHQIRIYPNPTKGQMVIEISDLNNTHGNINIVNLQGKVISNHTILNNQTNINISSQPAGIYIMSIIINGQASSWKIIKE